MKKNIILGIIIALLIVAVAVEGFFLWKQNDDKNKEEKKGETEQVEQTPSPEPSKEPKKLPKDETLDGENLKISKKYSNPKENELVYTYLTVTVEDKLNYNPEYNEDYWKYTYEIPQINIDTTDVEKINEEILQKYEDIVRKMNDRQEIDYMCEGISYKYYENDGILSLAMYNPTELGGYFEFNTYNIDIDYYFTSTQKEIDNKELLEKINITETDLKDKILEYIDNSEIYKDYPQADLETKNFTKQQKEKSKSKYKNISTKEIPLYVNNENHLCAYLEVYAIAGGETMTILLDLEKNKIIEIDRFLETE